MVIMWKSCLLSPVLWSRTDSWLKFLLVGLNVSSVHDSVLTMAATTYLSWSVQLERLFMSAQMEVSP